MLSALLMLWYLILICKVYHTGAENALYTKQDGNRQEFINRTLTDFNRKQLDHQKDNKRAVIKQNTCFEDSSCPPWYYCGNKSSECTCGLSHDHSIRCNQTLQTSAVLDCYCVTFDEKRNTTVAGACIYNCENIANKESLDPVYHKLPRNLSELNELMCNHHLNRTGPLCGECKPDTYPLVYSYNLSCVHCQDGHKNWWKYVLVAFLPLTIFCFAILFLKISVTSSHLHGYVFFCQIISVPQFIRFVLTAVKNHAIYLKVTLYWYSIWNLDFFRVLLPNICLRTSTLQTLALDYLVAVYPLFLLIVSYVLIELHDRNFRVVVFLWKPFRSVLMFFRKKWDCRTSVIDAYATFFVLSSTKFLSVSSDILTPARLYTLNSNETTLVLYYDASIEYFGKEHMPFAILAIILLLAFIIVPLIILLLYPLKLFQKFLNSFPVGWSNIIRTFVDSFLGCYKDGTDPGTRDCRWFAVLFLLWRIFALIIYSLTLESTYFQCSTITLLLLVMLMVIVQPFKPAVAHYTKLNVTFLLLLALYYTAISGMDVASIKATRFFKPYILSVGVIGSIPIIYIPCVIIQWIIAKRKWSRNLVSKFKAWRQGYDWYGIESDQDMEESLPDRIVNPNQYHEGNVTDFHNIRCASEEATLYTTY